MADRLLDVAARQLHVDGAPAVTLRRIAAEAGVSPTAVYRHYPSRAHLLREASAHTFSGLAHRLAADGQRPTVLGVVDAYVREATSSPSAYRHLTHSADDRLSAWPVLLAPLTKALASALHPAPPPEACQTVVCLVAATHGIVSLHVAGWLIPGCPVPAGHLARAVASIRRAHPPAACLP